MGTCAFHGYMLWVCSKVISVIMRTLNSDICSSVVSCFQFLNPSECTCDTCVLFSVLSPLSDRGSKPDPHGPQRSVWPLREDQAHPGPQERDQAEDQDHPFLPQPHLERELHIVSARHGDITPGSVASSTQTGLSSQPLKLFTATVQWEQGCCVSCLFCLRFKACCLDCHYPWNLFGVHTATLRTEKIMWTNPGVINSSLIGHILKEWTKVLMMAFVAMLWVR